MYLWKICIVCVDLPKRSASVSTLNSYAARKMGKSRDQRRTSVWIENCLLRMSIKKKKKNGGSKFIRPYKYILCYILYLMDYIYVRICNMHKNALALEWNFTFFEYSMLAEDMLINYWKQFCRPTWMSHRDYIAYHSISS